MYNYKEMAGRCHHSKRKMKKLLGGLFSKKIRGTRFMELNKQNLPLILSRLLSGFWLELDMIQKIMNLHEITAHSLEECEKRTTKDGKVQYLITADKIVSLCPAHPYLRYYEKDGSYSPPSDANLSEQLDGVTTSQSLWTMKKNTPYAYSVYREIEDEYQKVTGSWAHTCHSLSVEQYIRVVYELYNYIKDDDIDRKWMLKYNMDMVYSESGKLIPAFLI